jgi:hypothetical protein
MAQIDGVSFGENRKRADVAFDQGNGVVFEECRRGCLRCQRSESSATVVRK